MGGLDSLSRALADRYRIERELGAGGMATVYLAEDLKHSRKVAIKVLREDLAASMGSNRFLREIQIAAQLQHPNILPLLDSGDADGFLYYVMPYIAGQSLRERLAREGELPVHEAVRLLCEITDALAHAHQMGVVHRDVKPDNVMMSGRHALVTDFGVAKAISEATGRNAVTTLGVALGTPTYMSPEQAAADPNIDHRSDIYAVGVMAYEMLTGQPPFTGATPQQVLAAHVTQEADLVSKRRPAIAPALEQIVMRCLAKRPADRYQTAEELLHLLEAQATTSTGVTPTQTRPSSAWSAPANRRAWILPVTVAVAAALIATIWMRAGRDEAPAAVEARRTQLTFTGTAELAVALSPDGQRLAYADRQCGEDLLCTYSVVVQDVEGAGSARVVEGMQAIYELGWSGDGRTLLMGGLREGAQVAYYAVPALGGEPPRLISSSPVRLFGTADSALIVHSSSDSLLVLRATTLGSPSRGDTVVIRHQGAGVFSWTASLGGRWIALGALRRGINHVTIHDRSGDVRDAFELPDVAAAGFMSDDRVLVALRDPDSPGTVRVEERRLDDAGRQRGRPRMVARGLPANRMHISAAGLAYLDGTTRTRVIAIARDGAGMARITVREVASSTGFLSALMGSDGTFVILERADPADPSVARMFVQPFNGGEERLIASTPYDRGSSRSRTVDGRGLVVLSHGEDSTTISEVDLSTGRATPRGTMPYPGDIDGLEAMADGSIAWQPEAARSEIIVRSPSGTMRTIRTPQVASVTMEDSPDGQGMVGWGFALPNFDSVVVYHVPPGADSARSLVRAVFDYIPGHRWMPDGNVELVINETLATSAFYRLDVASGALTRQATVPLNFILAISFSNDGRRLTARTAMPIHDVWVLRWD